MDVDLSIIISFFSLVVDGIALGWNIYRDCIDKGKLKVVAFVADVFSHDGSPQSKVISLRVTNVGKKSIVVDGHSFQMKDRTNLMPKESYNNFNNRRLEPGEYISAILSSATVQTLIENVDRLYQFFVIDSYGKKWWLSDKEINEIIKMLNLIKQKKISS